MRLLVDQNLSPKTCNFLRALGHDVLDVRVRFLLGLTPASFACVYLLKRFDVLHPIIEREFSELQKTDLLGCLVVIDNWRVRLRRP